VRINEEWEVTRDPFNFVLVRYSVSNKGKVSEQRTYHKTLEQACNTLVRKSIDTESLESILSTIKESTNLVSEACKNISKESI